MTFVGERNRSERAEKKENLQKKTIRYQIQWNDITCSIKSISFKWINRCAKPPNNQFKGENSLTIAPRSCIRTHSVCGKKIFEQCAIILLVAIAHMATGVCCIHRFWLFFIIIVFFFFFSSSFVVDDDLHEYFEYGQMC